jgi:HSP20 family molecular chaperone IbpA
MSQKLRGYINCKIRYKCLTKKKEKTMFYTIDTFDKLFKELAKEPTYDYKTSQFEVEVLENGKQQVIINTLGHSPKNIQVDVTEEFVHITAKKEEGTSRFVKDIDLKLTVGTDYDGTKSEAKFENGLLVLLIDKKNERKSRTLKISY